MFPHRSHFVVGRRAWYGWARCVPLTSRLLASDSAMREVSTLLEDGGWERALGADNDFSLPVALGPSVLIVRLVLAGLSEELDAGPSISSCSELLRV